MQRLNICKLFRFFMEKVGKERAAFYEKGGAKPLHAPVPWQTARSISKIFFIIPEKNLLFSLICLFLILLDTFCSYYLKR